MNYEFIANSMFIFSVTLPSGLVKNVEFDEVGQGVYSYSTDRKEVADAIRRHTLVKNGRITDKTSPCQLEQKAEETDEDVMHFDNITKARNYLVKTYGVASSKLRTPSNVNDCAREHGIRISF